MVWWWCVWIITQVASGTNGIQSKTGDYHAIVEHGSAVTGPHVNFGQYRSVWPGNWKTQVDVYLDPSWPVVSGLVYSVASNNINGTFLRDFVLHAAVVDDETTGNVPKLAILGDTSGAPYGDVLYVFELLDENMRGYITDAG